MDTPRTQSQRIDAARKELDAATMKWQEATVEVELCQKRLDVVAESHVAALEKARIAAKHAKQEVDNALRRLAGS